jgi:hypothetical protein
VSKDRSYLEEQGFIGFVPIGELRTCPSDTIPDNPGLYAILRLSNGAPAFLDRNPGAPYYGKDSTYSLGELKDNWVDGAQLLFVGHTTSPLRKRVGAFLRYGAGNSVEHWTGRIVWQLKDADDLVVAWKPLNDHVEDPLALREDLLDEFKQKYNGRLPFANLKG